MAPLERAALTTEGVVLDLADGASFMSFEHGKESSPSHAAKEKSKEFYRMLYAAQVAHLQDEIELGLRYTDLGENVKMWIRTWPGIGMDESEVHLAIACKHLRRVSWFEFKTGVTHPSDGVYELDENGIVHKELAEIDGPALTLDGTVVDVDGGHKTFFSHSKELSPSHAAKQRAKDDFRMMRAAELAHYNDEVLMGDRVPVQSVICADADGIVHSGLPLEEESKDSVKNAKKKNIHRKKRSMPDPLEAEAVILVLDEKGMVQSKSPKNIHTLKKHMPFQSLHMTGNSTLCVDISGIVRTGKGFKMPPELESDDVPRVLAEPDAELSPQNPGASPEPCLLPVLEVV